MILPYVNAQANGIVFLSNLTEEQYREIGGHLASATRRLPWLWADWLAYPEREKQSFINISDRSIYRLAEEISGLAYQTLRNRKCVALSIPLLRRREELTFSHHDEVVSAGIHDTAVQDNWLDEAIKNNWSPIELRQAIRASKRTEPAIEKEEDEASAHRSRILREVNGLVTSLKNEDFSALTTDAAEALRESMEPLARKYQELCELVS